MINIHVEKDRLAELCRRHHVRELAIFGSTARGQSRPDSDVDLLVGFEPDACVGLLAFSQLARQLRELFGAPVDLVTRNGLHPLIRDQVLAEAEVLFEK